MVEDFGIYRSYDLGIKTIWRLRRKDKHGTPWHEMRVNLEMCFIVEAKPTNLFAHLDTGSIENT